MSDRKGDFELDLEKIRVKAIHDSIIKFRFFFAGLVFAILSYSIQKPIDTTIAILQNMESASWLLMVSSGILSIKECGGFSTKLTEKKVYGGLNPRLRWLMYGSFILAIGLLAASRILLKNA